MNYRSDGVIRNFGACREPQMEKMKTDLGIGMSIEQINRCVVYYRDRARRDPLIGEMKMLDRLASLPFDPVETAFLNLDTVDQAQAETLRDMMNKRYELRPEAKTPMTLGEGAALASAYLSRAGKCRLLAGCPMMLSDARELSLGDGCVTAEGSDFALFLPGADSAAGNVTTNDLFVLVSRAEQPMWKFRRTARNFFSNPEVIKKIRDVRVVGKRGILPELISCASGLYVDLRRLGLPEVTLSPELLVGVFDGYYLALIPKSEMESFIKAAEDCGLQAKAFVAITQGTQTSVTIANGQTIAIESDFLRSMMAHPLKNVALTREEGEISPIRHRIVTTGKCAYLSGNETFSERIAVGSVSVSAAICHPEQNPFRSALHTVFAAVLSCAAGGGDTSLCRLAIGCKFPTDSEKFGVCFSAVLGIYRAQAELGIPAASINTVPDDACQFPEITVYAISPSDCVKDAFTRSETSVYGVAVPETENGLPDFPVYRSLLAKLGELHAKDNFFSARGVFTESVTDTLRLMANGSLSCHLDQEDVASDGNRILALVLESSAALPFARIGTVKNNDRAQCELSNTRFDLPEDIGLIWRETPEILILAEQNDTDARVLATYLENRDGACVSVMDPVENGAVSRAILTAQAVIVCAGAALPDTPAAKFAVEVFSKAGGQFFSVGACDPLSGSVPHLFFGNGLC